MPQRWGETPWNFLSQDDPLRQRFIGQISKETRNLDTNNSTK